MSACTVDLEHIHVLVQAGMSFEADHNRVQWVTNAHPSAPGVTVDAFSTTGAKYRRAVAGAANSIGQSLVSANWQSAHYFYNAAEPEPEPEPYYQYCTPRRIDREPIEILVAIAGLRDISRECPEWEKCEAYRYLNALEHTVVGRLPDAGSVAR